MADVMAKVGFEQGVWSPCLFVHRERQMLAYVYGDNFVLKGGRDEALRGVAGFHDHEE